MALEGDLRDFSLINVMQIICMERRKAGLFVRRRGEEAVIYFDGGDVVYANAGHLQGEEAIYQLLTWTDGTFRTTDQIGIPSKNIVKNWNHLLIEGMKRLDEQRRDASAAVQNDRTLSTSETRQDRNLEDGLMVLLSGLEQSMARLSDKRMQKRPELAQQLLSEVVNRAVEFSEKLPGSRAPLHLNSAVRQASAVYPGLAKVRVEGNRLAADAEVNSSGRWKSLFGDRHSNLRDLGHGLILVLESYFSLFASFFLSPSMRDQWKETYSVFIVDLKKNVDSVQF